MVHRSAAVRLLVLLLLLVSSPAFAQRQMEYLGRGVVAVNKGDGNVFVSWRMLGTDPDEVAYNLYRATGADAPVKLNSARITDVTCFDDSGVKLDQPVKYTVRALLNGAEQPAGEPFTLAANAPAVQYHTIPLKLPADYRPGDCSAADLDGDGEYEIVVHMAGRGRDNSQDGETTPPIFQAYKLDGTLMWEINLGRNIREGAHYTQFLVYDFDGDGRAEMICKTADGTKDATGKVIGDASKNWVDRWGHVLDGPEFLTVFDGRTGAALATTDYVPARHPVHPMHPSGDELIEQWRDDHGNRSERYLAGVAYLDGKLPSAVMCRGYYSRTTLCAWDWRGGKLTQRWLFDTGPDRSNPYYGQGFHALSVADVDDDGKDEIIYGACTIDDDGEGLYSTRWGHGDALHVGDLDPEHPGLEVFGIQERFDDAGAHMHDAKTGTPLWKKPSVKAAETGGDRGEGPGRGVCFDVDPRYPGNESWAFGAGMHGMWSAKGEDISDVTPRSCNFAVWWDADLLRELLDRNQISKWNWEQKTTDVIFTATDCMSNNGTKSTPALSADLYGDWREEVIFRTTDNTSLRIYTTTIPAKNRLRTLMHDPQYRLAIAWQNVAYNQPPHPSFYIGPGMKAPPKPQIAIRPRMAESH